MQLPWVILLTALPTFTCSYPEQPIEEKSTYDKILEHVHESERQVQKLKNLQAHQDFQIQDPYSIFQVPTQQEEPIDLGKIMKFMTQSQNDYIQSQNDSFNRLEA